MPWDVVQRKGKFVVVDKHGKVYGTHPSKKAAREQQKALYAAYDRKHKET
jgi:hypothetical protein